MFPDTSYLDAMKRRANELRLVAAFFDELRWWSARRWLRQSTALRLRTLADEIEAWEREADMAEKAFLVSATMLSGGKQDEEPQAPPWSGVAGRGQKMHLVPRPEPLDPKPAA